ncbi:branched-chain amino acid aminotransferase [Diplogelasinospora grovesii]|uniref:Branched-chain amino acid aminotransferase n=1 Tax=Diplogelasinospora grovesii TaxID=303347 RepID=A0AAN6MYY6_9PEZI|nr:branched-chain amino acid aminotransferase [Diplogelasinospora grovesii]
MTSFPPAPTTALDWTNPAAFSKFQEVNGHVESTYSNTTKTWSPLKFVPDPCLRIHGLAPGLNYGQQAFEGLKAFRLPSGAISIFRPDRNGLRLRHSSAVLNMPAVPLDLFVSACRAAVAHNAEFVPPHETGWSLYCRPLTFASAPQFPPGVPEEVTFCVYVFPTPSGEEGEEEAVVVVDGAVKALILDDFDRAAPKGTGNAKAGGNYAGVLRWQGRAKTDGYDITLHLDSSRHEEVDEFSLCGFIGVVLADTGGGGGGGVTTTTLVIPKSPCAIDSLTSDSVQQIAKGWGWQVEKKVVRYTDLPEFSEVIGAGTAVGLVSVRSITRRGTAKLDNRHPRVAVDKDGAEEVVKYIPDDQKEGGPIFRKLLGRFRAIQTGEVADEFGWRFEVREEDKGLAA